MKVAKRYRAAGKTTRMIEAAKALGKPVALVFASGVVASHYAKEVGNGSEGYSIRGVDEAYMSGLPVFVDSSCFDSMESPVHIAQEQLIGSGDEGWQRLPEWH